MVDVKEKEYVTIEKDTLDELVRNLHTLEKMTGRDKIDYRQIGEEDYAGASITAFSKDPLVVRRRASILARGVGEGMALAEEVIRRILPYTESLMRFLFTSADWSASEQAQALSEMNATLSKRYLKRYPAERVIERTEEQEEEGGGL